MIVRKTVNKKEVEMSKWEKIDGIPAQFLDGRSVLIAIHDEWACEGQFKDGAWYELNNSATDSWGGPLLPTHYQEMPLPPGRKANMRCPRCGNHLDSDAHYAVIKKVRDVVGAKCIDCGRRRYT